MKTKTLLLLFLFLGIGLTRISAQTDVYKFPVSGVFPVSCDGITVDWVNIEGPLLWLTHSQRGVWTWVKALSHYSWKSSVTGEVFKCIEMDPGIENYDPETGGRVETGTWHAIMIGDQGSHYNITWSYVYNENEDTWTFEFLSAKCH